MQVWTRRGNSLLTLLNQQELTPKEGAPIERWTPLHQLELDTYKQVLRQQDSIHAFCEYRERQRNAKLGEPPTIFELAEILNTPEQKNPEVDKVSFSPTPTITPQLDPITTDFLPHR
jgi:1-deoxy-D-xylulose 5-phosphate reductoisomerase